MYKSLLTLLINLSLFALAGTASSADIKTDVIYDHTYGSVKGVVVLSIGRVFVDGESKHKFPIISPRNLAGEVNPNFGTDGHLMLSGMNIKSISIEAVHADSERIFLAGKATVYNLGPHTDNDHIAKITYQPSTEQIEISSATNATLKLAPTPDHETQSYYFLLVLDATSGIKQFQTKLPQIAANESIKSLLPLEADQVLLAIEALDESHQTDSTRLVVLTTQGELVQTIELTEPMKPTDLVKDRRSGNVYLTGINKRSKAICVYTVDTDAGVALKQFQFMADHAQFEATYHPKSGRVVAYTSSNIAHVFGADLPERERWDMDSFINADLTQGILRDPYTDELFLHGTDPDSRSNLTLVQFNPEKEGSSLTLTKSIPIGRRRDAARFCSNLFDFFDSSAEHIIRPEL